MANPLFSPHWHFMYLHRLLCNPFHVTKLHQRHQHLSLQCLQCCLTLKTEEPIPFSSKSQRITLFQQDELCNSWLCIKKPLLCGIVCRLKLL